MPRKAFKCSVELTVYTVTCPGTRHLTDRNMLYLVVRILGEARRTKSVFASFPLSYNEHLYFERTFTNAREPAHVVEMLEDENVLFELVQYSDIYKGGKVLARYEQPAREFLYPTPTLTGKNGMGRELLLGRTVHFSGIDPKLEFSSSSTIQETTVPSSFTELKGFSKPRAIQSDTEESDGSSDTEEEIVVTPRAKRQLSKRDTHCICECPRRPENRGRVVVRSRSLSPSHRPQSTSLSRKPPFKAGKADESIISRRSFPNSRGSRSKHRVVVIPEGEPLPCSSCRTPRQDCIVCAAYHKVYGKDFLSYRFGHDDSQHRTTSAPLSEPPRRQLTPPEDEPPYESRAYSAPLPLSRRIFPRVRGEHYSGSYLSSDSTSDEIHERVDRIIRKHSPQPQYSRSYEEVSDDDSLFSLQELRSEINEARMDSLDRSFEDPDHPTLGTRLDRSVTVPLSDDKYWSNRKYRFTGRSHRAVFEGSMKELYSDLYRRAART